MSNQEAPLSIRLQVNELMAQGNYTDAASLLGELCKSVPRSAEVRYLLGCCLGRLGRWDEAVHVLQQCIDMWPNVARFHYTLGKLQLALDQYQAAIESFRHALEQDATLTEVHMDMANTCFVLRDFKQSRQYYRNALQLNPSLAVAYHGLGCIAHETGQMKQAIEYLEQALEHQPDSIETLCILGSALYTRTQIEESATCYGKALQINPDSAEAAAGMASIYELRGETEKAVDLIEPLVQRHNLNPALGIAFAKLCKHSNRCEEAVGYINRVLESSDPDISTRTRRILHFTVANVLDKLQQFDAAFTHFKAANDAESQQYNAAGFARKIGDTIGTYNPGLYMRLPRATRHDSRPVFIVGMPRSGTSLTEQILAAHANVHAAGELYTLDRIVMTMPQKPGGIQELPGRVAFLGQQDIDNMANVYLTHLDSLSSSALRITDKMPGNFINLGIIQLLFPGARIIHCTRNPLDNGLSIYFQDFSSEHDYAKDLFNIGAHYHQYQRLMAHWKETLTLPLLELGYEQLVSDQEKITRRILEFCELEWDDNCLQFHKLDRNALTASYDQVRQPLYQHSVERWRNYERYIDELKDGLKCAS